MATSPNYGWSEPDNSSLVKNGAADIRTLGDAIDTSVWNVGFGQAGKNKIINGDFRIWQRGTTLTDPAGGVYLADRWRTNYGGLAPTARTYNQQTFTAGTAPVAGYEGTFFARMTVTTKGTNVRAGFGQPIEDVRTFAGQAVTVSFWAKSDSARTGAIQIQQNFGTGGSTTVEQEASINLTSSWQRFTQTFTLGSMSGKTIGTDTALILNIFHTSANGSTLDLWGVQVEYGSKATPFQTASGGSPQAELAMCQRYYVRFGGSSAYENFGSAFATSTTQALCLVNLPVTQRIAASAVEYSTNALYDLPSFFAVTAFSINGNSTNQIRLQATVASGLTQYRPCDLLANNSTSAYLGFSAEL